MKKLIFHMFMMIIRLMLLVLVLSGLFRLGNYAYDFGKAIYSPRGVSLEPGTDMAIVIREGQTVSEIAQMLENYGLIADDKVFLVQERLSKYHGQIQAGNYVLNNSQSGNTMIDIITGHREENGET